MSASENAFYATGGTLRSDAACYVERQADNDLLEGLIRGEFCYVLTSRQMGKSSLMVRTARKLRERKIRVAVLDLTAVGLNLTPEQWYDGLAANVGRQLQLEDQLDHYWRQNLRYGPAQRFFGALGELVLTGPSEPLAIFVDEIDAVRSLPFSGDEFFAAIRECYNRRTEEPGLNRLTFCLLGVATPADLIRDTPTTPFNIGTRIELKDFNAAQAIPLAKGLGVDEKVGKDLLDRIIYWTNGHPYLTQRLCRETADANSQPVDPKLRINSRRSIDRLCEGLFFSERAREKDDNLLFVRERLLRSDVDLEELLSLYGRVRNFEKIRDDDSNPLIEILRLSGITTVEKKFLRVRNRIYERVFNHDWIMANIPVLRSSGTIAIAVLPFSDASGDSLNEYWTDGLTEEVINALGQVPGLTAASRGSVFQFKTRRDLREISTRLNVQVILEGVVRRLGDRVRISVELASVPDGYRLWAEAFNYRAKDLFEIQDEITAAIVARLRFGLRHQPETRGARAPTENAEAYSLYLKGRYDWNKRHEEAVHRSVALFQEAIQKDPNFALAYAGLADAYNILGAYNYLAPGETYPKAKIATLKALELDDKLAHAHAALGCVFSIHDWNWARAETEFKRAIQLNPSYATGRQSYAIYCLTPLGRHDEAIAELRKAQALDPFSLGVQASLALAFYCARRYDQAIEQCRLTLEMEPNFRVAQMFLAWALMQLSKFDEAIAAAERSVELGKNDPVASAALGYAFALAGDRGKAARVAEELAMSSNKIYVPAGEVAILWLGLKDFAKAMQWFSRAYEERALRLIYSKVDPRLDSVRTHPQFLELLAKIGFPEQGQG